MQRQDSTTVTYHGGKVGKEWKNLNSHLSSTTNKCCCFEINFSETQFRILLNKEISAGHPLVLKRFPLIS